MTRLAALFALILPVTHARAVTMMPVASAITSGPHAVTLSVNIPIGEYSTSLHQAGGRPASRAASNVLDAVAADPWPPPLAGAATPTRVPEPASLALIGIGLAGLIATRRRVNRRC